MQDGALSKKRPWTRTVTVILSALVAVAGAARADDATQPESEASENGALEPGELLPTGYVRITGIAQEPLGAKVRDALERSGKLAEIDPVTGERIVHTVVDRLPEGWGAGNAGDGVPIDSLGRLIVNTAPGLPGWAQADVDALREAIRHWASVRAARVAAGEDPTEADGILGNYVGQAIVRSIAFDDLVRLDDRSKVGEVMARSIIGYLHFYESVKSAPASDQHYVYEPSVYPERIVAFVAAHGSRMEDVLRIGAPEVGRPESTLSSCYYRATFARGMSLLTGQTDIWVANPTFDDAFADVPTGFPIFYFYECGDPDNNDMVRVSTNGYISFFQQGGGATVGTSHLNGAIPAAADPDGYAAPWWDDLIVAAAQGSPDRVSYKTEGAIDQRVFTVEWFSMSRVGGGVDDYHFFQVKLYETSGVIEFQFDLNWNTDASDDSTTGLENYSGSDGDCGPNCLNSNNPPPPNDYRFSPVRPDNDECAYAFPVHYAQTVNQWSLRSAGADGDATCGSSSNNRDVWYLLTAGCAGTLSVSTCGTRDTSGNDTGPDTVLSAHTGCPGNTANQLACSDDAGAPTCDLRDSAISVPVAANQQVFLRVTHHGDLVSQIGNGLFNLNSSFVPSAPPSNDTCANASDVASGGTYFGNLSCAGADGDASCGLSTGNPDNWYVFTAPAPGGALSLDTCGSRDSDGAGSGPNTVLSVHGSCPGLQGNQAACNDQGGVSDSGCNASDSRLSTLLATGQRAFVRVSHFAAGPVGFLGNGSTTLHVGFAACSLPTGDIANLRFTDKTTLSWNADPAANGYDIVRGDLGQLPVGPAGGDEACAADATLVTTAVDGAVPPAQHGFWYAVRANNGCGSYGNGHVHPGPVLNGPPRLTLSCP